MITKALKSLRPTASFSVIDEEYSKIIWYSGDIEIPSEVELQAELARLQADYDAKQYQRNRAAEYPSFADQFDTLYHGGYDAWKAQIDAIKLKHPKP